MKKINFKLIVSIFCIILNIKLGGSREQALALIKKTKEDKLNLLNNSLINVLPIELIKLIQDYSKEPETTLDMLIRLEESTNRLFNTISSPVCGGSLFLSGRPLRFDTSKRKEKNKKI